MDAASESLIVRVLERPSPDWDSFVAVAPGASIYHRSAWVRLAKDVFGHTVACAEARNAAGALVGVLPVVRQKSLLLGTFATSLPFCNHGGAVCATPEVALALMNGARSWADEAGCAYLEFRDERPLPGDWSVRTDKVTMELSLPPTLQELSKQLGSKLRSQVKRADREQPSVHIGGAELVPQFYDVFARNMRSLGTPVYPRRFFEAVQESLPDQSLVITVSRNGVVGAAGFLMISGGRAEIPWAACSDEAKPLAFNMKLYWEALAAAIERGCRVFDFGRSTVDAGTYRFKAQWGAQPRQLYWHRWEGHAKHAQESGAPGKGRVMQLAASVWRRLPLKVANTVGPWIAPSLPW